MGDHPGRRISSSAATYQASGSVEAVHAVEPAGPGGGADAAEWVRTTGPGDVCVSPLPVAAEFQRAVRSAESAGRVESAGRADCTGRADSVAAADLAVTARRGRLLRSARAGRQSGDSGPVGAAGCARPTRRGGLVGIRARSWTGLLHTAFAALAALVGLPAEIGPDRRRRDRSVAGSTARRSRRVARSDRACPRCRGRRTVATPGSRLPFDTICCPECR